MKPFIGVKCQAASRLHFGLIDLGHATARRYGGAGLAIAHPSVSVIAEHAFKTSVVFTDVASSDYRSECEETLERALRNQPGGVKITVEASPEHHIGLGSKTSILLALLASVNLLLDLGLGPHDLIKLSGRGGTSGIGINCFFSGGFVIDGGRRDEQNEPFQPSRYNAFSEPPPLRLHRTFPDKWDITLAIFPGRKVEGCIERDLFATSTPIPRSECYEAISLAYIDLVEAIDRTDIQLLSNTLARFNDIGFKKREVENQPTGIQSALTAFQKLPNTAAGMSSMGPTLFVITRRSDAEAIDRVRHLAQDATLLTTHASVKGHHLERLS